MKLLHLFSNYKLTGPAEPALRLAAELGKRGHEVLLAHPAPRHPDAGYVDSRAAEHGLATTTGLNLRKHLHLLSLWQDVRRLPGFLDARGIEIVHCHLLNDHLTAALAAAKCRTRPRIVRTNHLAAPMPRHLRNRLLFPRRCDALIELSPAALEADARTFHIPRDRLHLSETPVDLARFDPLRELPDMRARLGLRPEDFVVGIAARIQARRRFDVLLDAAALAREALPSLKVLVIGRGTHMETVAVRPAHARGLDDVVVFPGYLRNDAYVGALLALDAKVFLVPGTDGSCRAAREAMALGRPVIAARRGVLPELVEHETTGLVIDDTPENLAQAVLRLARDPALRREMGAAARQAALRRFDPARQAEQVERIYEQLL